MPVAAIIVATEKASWSDEALALLPWSAQTLIEYHVEQLQAAGVRDIEVVLGYDAERVIPLVAADNVEPIVNATWANDVPSSLRTGASAVVRGTTAALVVDVAEPRPAFVVRTLIDAHERASPHVTLPTFEGTRGTPIVLGGHALAALRNVRGDGDVWSIVERFKESMQALPSDNNVVLLRIDDHPSYDAAREAFGRR